MMLSKLRRFPCSRCVARHSKSYTAQAQLPTETDVVVIGGGSLGCSTAYHLMKLGVRNCVLLEKDKLTAGTTWHTAGLLWRLRPSDVDIELIAHTRRLNVDILEKESGLSSGWIGNGGLFIASSKERLDEYKRLHTLGHAFGIESHVLGPQETKKLYPLMNVKDVYGTLYSPGDGLIDPSSYCAALAKAAQKNGAKIVEGCRVGAIQTATDDFGRRCVTALETSLGVLRTKVVVNCAGAWGQRIGTMAGVRVPLCAMRHAYVITERIDGVQNMPNVRDHDASVYLRLQGDALAVGGYESNPEFLTELKDDFAFSLFDLNWDVFDVHIRGAVNRVPALEHTGIKSEVCGPESFTPDHKPLMGEAPEVKGFFLGCGFNSAGMMLGGGCGQQLAQWVVHGRPELHMYNYDIRRFSQKVTGDTKWIKERSHESYAKNYSIVFPHDEPLAGRNIRKDPFYDVLLDKGCVFQERLSWERPAWFAKDGNTAAVLPYDYYGAYGHTRHKEYTYEQRLAKDYSFDWPEQHHVIEQEALACRNACAIFDMSYFGKFYITGPDSQAAVDWIFSNDLHKPAGSVIYTCMLNARGGVEADLTVCPVEPGRGSACAPQFEGRGFYVAAGGAIANHVWQHIRSQIHERRFRVTMLDETDHMGLLSVQGRHSRDILQSLTDDDLSDEGLAFSNHKLVTIAGRKCRVLRLSFVGELGYELHIPNDSCLPIYKALMQAGQNYGIVNAGYRAIDALSLEKGYRLWGTDLRHSDTPLEAGLSFTCKLKKDTPFLGRESLEKQQAAGLKKRLAFLFLKENKPIWGLETVYRNGEPVGFCRRAEFAFTLKRPIAAAYMTHGNGTTISNEWIKSGEYFVECMGTKLPADIAIKAQFDSDNMRLKGIYA